MSGAVVEVISLIKPSREMQQHGASDGRCCFAGWKTRRFLHRSPAHLDANLLLSLCSSRLVLMQQLSQLVCFISLCFPSGEARACFSWLARSSEQQGFLRKKSKHKPHLQPCSLHHQTQSPARKSLPAPYSFWSAKTSAHASSPEGFPSIWPCHPYLVSLLCLPVLGRVAAVLHLVSPSCKAQVKLPSCLPDQAAVQIN